MQQRTDAELVMLACTGNKDASNELVRRYQTKAKQTALKIVRQEELAYEITQEAFLAAYLSLDQLRDPARFGGWLTSIVRNFAFSVLKEQRNRPISLEQILQDQTDSSPESILQRSIDPQEQAEEHALQHLLLATIATLSTKERNAVLLYYYQQHSIQEIATLLDISETAVKSRLFKARKTLRGQLSAEYETASPSNTRKKGKHTVAEEPQAYQSNISRPPKHSKANMRILTLAYNESRLLDQPYIGTEHLLLALFHNEIEETAKLLSRPDLDLGQARQLVRTIIPHIPGEVARGMVQDSMRVLTGGTKLAQHFQHEEQTPLHLLLSLLLQGQTLADQALQHMSIQPEELRILALQHLLGEEQARNSNLRELQQVLVLEEPLVRGSEPVDTQRENGIRLDVDKALRSFQEAQQKVLKNYRVDDPEYERIKQTFERSQRRLQLTKRPDSTIRARISISYTDVLMHANNVRIRFGHTHHGPEHLLFGLLQITNEQARIAQILDRFPIDRQSLLTALEQLLTTDNYEHSGLFTQNKGTYTEQADKAIEYAYEEAYHFEHNFIGAEHLLIGLLRLQDNSGAKLLQKAGLNAEKIRNELRLLPLPVL